MKGMVRITKHSKYKNTGLIFEFLLRQIKYLFTSFNETQNIHKNFLNKLFNNICTGEDYLITVGDDVDEVYSASVTSIGSITVTVNND